MKKSAKIIIGIIIFILLLIASFFIFKYEAGENEIEDKTPRICCNDTCFNLEIADNDELRKLGLMYRGSLSDSDGMLFVYDIPGIYSFRMKNTLIPLAGIWLDSDLKVVDIILMDPCKTTECPSYKPKSEAQYVLEINQGLISEKGLFSVGDFCNIEK